MKKHIQVLRMMSVLVWAVAACAILPARAALTVTATNGVESLTLAFDAAADARELWCAWDDADKGAGMVALAKVGTLDGTLTTANKVTICADGQTISTAKLMLSGGILYAGKSSTVILIR